MLFLTLIVWFPSYILSLYLILTKTEQILFHGAHARDNLAEASPVGNNPGGWLARLGWGLGEASVEILDAKPTQTMEARIAFFGRAIPEEGLTGWLVPLDSILEPCPLNEENGAMTLIAPHPLTSTRNSRSPPMPFMGLDGAYELEVEYEYDDSNDPTTDPDNTGCPPLCPIGGHGFSRVQASTLDGDDKDDGEEPFTPFPNTTWIALVQRGTCSFATKAQYAQSFGATGLIVGGLDNNLISMSASGATGAKIDIASIFVGHNSYVNLTAAVERSGVRIGVGSALTSDGTNVESEKTKRVREVRTIMVRLDGEPPWEWYTPILSLLLVLSLPSLLTLCTLLVHRVRMERRDREMRAPEDIVAGLPVRIWTGTGWEKDLERGRLARLPALEDGTEAHGERENHSTETSPLLPVRSDSKEGGRGNGYGAIDPEPSTSAPQGLTIPSPNHGSDDGDIEGGKTHPSIHPALSPEPLSPSTERDGTVSASVRGQSHHQEASDETIPRPPWFASQTECAICICEFEVGDRVRVLPCGHIFHKDEVDPWLIKQRKVCPVCKYDVTNPPTAQVPASSSPVTSAVVSAAAAEDEPPSPPATDTGVAPSVYSHVSGNRSTSAGGPVATGTGVNPNGGQGAGGTDVTAAQLLARLDEHNTRPGLFSRWRAWVNSPQARTEIETEQANPT